MNEQCKKCKYADKVENIQAYCTKRSEGGRNYIRVDNATKQCELFEKGVNNAI